MANNLSNINLAKLTKIGIGSAIAIILSASLGLQYSPSAGIITLLTIQNTKKETIEISLKRILSFGAALVISNILFETLGYTALVFGLFLFVFVAFSELVNLQDGISMNAVLTTHFLIEKTMNPAFILNEFCILMIGMITGVAINLVMRKNNHQIKDLLYEMDTEMKELLCQLADYLLSEEKQNQEVDFKQLNTLLSKSIQQVQANKNNNLVLDTNYFVQYSMMRKNQSNILHSIYQTMRHMTETPMQATIIASFLKEISELYHEKNDVEELLKQYHSIKHGFRKNELPHSRDEFENRARLFQIITMIEQFLLIKQEFVFNLTPYQIKQFWTT